MIEMKAEIMIFFSLLICFNIAVALVGQIFQTVGTKQKVLMPPSGQKALFLLKTDLGRLLKEFVGLQKAGCLSCVRYFQLQALCAKVTPVSCFFFGTPQLKKSFY